MILETDFLDHWKTRLFVQLMGGDEAATNYILRLWFHCQLRRRVDFEEMTPEILKAVCRFNGDENQLWQAFTQTGLAETETQQEPCKKPKGIRVPKWGEANQKLFANWENGRKGGRPSNSGKTQGKGKSKNPTITHSKPEGMEGKEDKTITDQGSPKADEPPIVVKTNGIEFQGLPQSLDTSEFKEVWMLWEKYQRESGKGIIQPITRVQNFTDLAKLGTEKAVQVIRLAIGKGWKSLVFDPELRAPPKAQDSFKLPSVAEIVRRELEETMRMGGPATPEQKAAIKAAFQAKKALEVAL